MYSLLKCSSCRKVLLCWITATSLLQKINNKTIQSTSATNGQQFGSSKFQTHFKMSDICKMHVNVLTQEFLLFFFCLYEWVIVPNEEFNQLGLWWRHYDSSIVIVAVMIDQNNSFPHAFLPKLEKLCTQYAVRFQLASRAMGKMFVYSKLQKSLHFPALISVTWCKNVNFEILTKVWKC